LTEEEQRIRHYLSETTEPKIRAIVEKQMISKHLKTVIEVTLSFGVVVSVELEQVGLTWVL